MNSIACMSGAVMDALSCHRELLRLLLLFVLMLLPGPLAIGISLVAAGLAAANLLLDMDWIEKVKVVWCYGIK